MGFVGNVGATPYRRIENIRKLNAIYIDIDYYNIDYLKELTFNQIIWSLEKDYFNQKIPTPSFVVNTGRGLAMYWLIEPVPSKVLPLWNVVQKHFLDMLKGVGADSKSIDSARIMRIAGSTNQKTGNLTELHIYNEDYLYTLRELQEEYLPDLTPYVKNPCHKQKGNRSKVVN